MGQRAQSSLEKSPPHSQTPQPEGQGDFWYLPLTLGSGLARVVHRGRQGSQSKRGSHERIRGNKTWGGDQG